MPLDLLSLSPEVSDFVKRLEAENARLQLIINLKNEQIRLLHLRQWGPKADKLSENQLSLLPLELVVVVPEIELEAELPEPAKVLTAVPRAKAPKNNHPGRATLPAHLERREEIIPCSPQDCTCGACGAPRPVIGYEVREELGCRPAEFFVRVIKREKRGSHCRPEQGVTVTPAPGQIVPKSKLSNEFIIEVLAAKFQQHTPVYRQCARLLEDHGLDLSRQTLNAGILAAAQLLVPVVQAQAAELLAGDYLQADETTVPCQVPETTGKNHRAYLWEYGRPSGPVVFDFRMGRGRTTCLGKRNWLFLGHPDAGWRSAHFYSLIASCRRRAIDPWEYLRDLFARLPALTNQQIDELLPANWKPRPK